MLGMAGCDAALFVPFPLSKLQSKVLVGENQGHLRSPLRGLRCHVLVGGPSEVLYGSLKNSLIESFLVLLGGFRLRDIRSFHDSLHQELAIRQHNGLLQGLCSDIARFR